MCDEYALIVVLMNDEQTEKSPTTTANSAKATTELAGLQRAAVVVLGLFVRVWMRSLRLHYDATVKTLINPDRKPAVVILWHNRLLLAPELFRRNFPERKIAGLISASSDGAWLAGFFEQLSIKPIRGSRHGRSKQAFRELLKASRAGYDIGITPDGSRGPMYDMKAGAATLAVRAGVPVMLLSFNYKRAWRLKSWDRFYIPLPFSRVDVRVDDVGDAKALAGADPRAAAVILKERLMAITEDDEYLANKDDCPKG